MLVAVVAAGAVELVARQTAGGGSGEDGRATRIRKLFGEAESIEKCWDARLENIGSLLSLLYNYIRAAAERQRGGGFSIHPSPAGSGGALDDDRSVSPLVAGCRGILAAQCFFCVCCRSVSHWTIFNNRGDGDLDYLLYSGDSCLLITWLFWALLAVIYFWRKLSFSSAISLFPQAGRYGGSCGM